MPQKDQNLVFVITVNKKPGYTSKFSFHKMFAQNSAKTVEENLRMLERRLQNSYKLENAKKSQLDSLYEIQYIHLVNA